MKDLLFCVHVVVETFETTWISKFKNLEIQVVIWQTTFENLTKLRAARAARLFLVIQPMRSLFSGVVVAVAVVLACNRELWHQRRERQQQHPKLRIWLVECGNITYCTCGTHFRTSPCRFQNKNVKITTFAVLMTTWANNPKSWILCV